MKDEDEGVEVIYVLLLKVCVEICFTTPLTCDSL